MRHRDSPPSGDGNYAALTPTLPLTLTLTLALALALALALFPPPSKHAR